MPLSFLQCNSMGGPLVSANLTWRTHSCVPRRDSSRRRFSRLRNSSRSATIRVHDCAPSPVASPLSGRHAVIPHLAPAWQFARFSLASARAAIIGADSTRNKSRSFAEIAQRRHRKVRQSPFGPNRGAFWQKESYDHWVRSPSEYQKIRTYIETNPVKAGLVRQPQDFPWSSAGVEMSLDAARTSACATLG
jgi:hypothetical protein